MGNLWKYATLVALAFIPLALMQKQDDDFSPKGREVDSDEIFDLDLDG